MAGSYPNVPSRRMAWDDDKTVGLLWQSAFSFLHLEMTAQQKANLNDEVAPTYAIYGGDKSQSWPTMIFPELRECDGIFVQTEGFTVQNVVTSVDTTNGNDGTWVTQIASYGSASGVSPQYRNNIKTMAVSNVRGIRWNTNGNPSFWTWHMYGEITPGQTPDRLLYIDTGTALEFGLPIDYGDIPRGSAADYGLKVRNNSSTLTAGTVQITAESLYLASGNWYSFSEGGAFQSTLPLGSSIGPSSDSPALTLRRIIPDTETVGLHAGRVQTSVGSWS